MIRPHTEELLSRPRAQALSLAVNRLALPLFLFHTTGMALARAMDYFMLSDGIVDDRDPDWIWWAQRPLAILGALLFTLPLVIAFTRRRTRHMT